MRSSILGFLVLASLSFGWAAESAEMVAEAHARHEQADSDLASARAKILSERIALTKRLQELEGQADRLRGLLAEAASARDAAVAQAKKIRLDHDHELLMQRQLVDRAVIAAHLTASQAGLIAPLSPRERLRAALEGLTARLDALTSKYALHFGAESIIGRTGVVRTVPVLRLGQARAIAIGDDDATRGALARTSMGSSWIVSGPSLPTSVQSLHLDCIPLDPDNTAFRQVGTHQRSLIEWIRGGRFFIWPIIAVLILGLSISVERMVVLFRDRISPRRIQEVAQLIMAGSMAQVLDLVGGRRTALDRVLADGSQSLHRPIGAREMQLDQTLLAEAPRLQRGLGLLMVLAGIAPLLGLLGTVTGMIDMFSVIANQGSGNAKSLSGSISEALITTQAGMMVAIPLLILHAVLARIADRRLMLLEEAACSILGLEGKPSPGGTDRPEPAATREGT